MKEEKAGEEKNEKQIKGKIKQSYGGGGCGVRLRADLPKEVSISRSLTDSCYHNGNWHLKRGQVQFNQLNGIIYVQWGWGGKGNRIGDPLLPQAERKNRFIKLWQGIKETGAISSPAYFTRLLCPIHFKGEWVPLQEAIVIKPQFRNRFYSPLPFSLPASLTLEVQ